jgi:hypothetical protein
VVLFDGLTSVVYDINNIDGIILPTECDKVTEVGTISGVQVALTLH